MIITIEDFIEEGREKVRKEHVFNGLKAGYEDDVIMKVTHVSKEELEEYKEEYRKEISTINKI